MERRLHEKYVAGGAAWTRRFAETRASLRFPCKGEPLTSAEVLNRLTDREEAARREAARSLGKVRGDNARVFSLITNTRAKDKEIEDRWRQFDRPVSSRNLEIGRAHV